MSSKTNERDYLGKVASIVGVFANTLLSISKILTGLSFGIVSILADGFNNLSDSISSIIAYISFKLSAKPADKEHPYGHERIEYILAMAISVLILLFAFELIKESVSKIIHPTEAQFSVTIAILLISSIIIKIGLYFFNRHIAKKIDSDVLKATAVDCLSDSIATTVVFLALIAGKYTSLNPDGYAGILVSLFIGWAGIKVLKDTFSKLIGQAPTEQMIQDIKAKILAHKEVLGIHDLIVHCYGPNKYFASVHIELDASVDVMASHEIVDEIEREFAQNTNITLIGHLDPVEINNPEVNEMREKISDIVNKLDDSFSMHDFRMLKGPTRTNLIFDIAIPYETTKSADSIKRELEDMVHQLSDKYYLVVTIEYQTLK